MIEAEESLDLTPIQQFYSKTNVFVTGATGFLGKILLEKLLRSCPDLATIYILVRNKKGKNLQSRVEEIFEDSVFDLLKKECPKFQHKVVGVGGDCSVPDLGLSEQDRQLLINEINIVFHVAATVRFDEKLKLAVAINVRSPLDMLNLSKKMQNLKAFIHVSTAYCNVPQQVIEEKIYPSPVDSKKLILLAETLSDKVLENITPALLEAWPNTYAYTKMVAEDIIRQESNNLPIGIFRPAIVIGTYKEPIKGWINNLYGPTGVCAGAGMGIIRTLNCNPKVNANIVPVDLCTNSLIASAWEVDSLYKKDSKNFDIPVYNYVASNDNPISWGEFLHLASVNGVTIPSSKAIWYYSLTLQRTRIGYFLTALFLHYLPAVIADLVLFVTGRGPKMLKVYRKIHKFTDVISYFATREWGFHNANVRRLIDSMSERDKEIFFCDMKKLVWNNFFMPYMAGIRIYLCQDPMETVPMALSRWRRLFWAHQLIKIVAGFLLFRLAWWFFSIIFL